MTLPKFSVGEEVILQSIDRPEFDGIYGVEGVVFEGARYVCSKTGVNVKLSLGYGFAYKLAGLCPLSDKGCEAFWAESAPRKKHDPGEMTFEGLMMSLNNPVNVES